MNLSQNDARLSLFPQVGTDIKVLLQDGHETFSYGRISCDGEFVIIDVIKKSRRPKEFPVITKIVSLELKDIIQIRFRNLDGQRVSLLGDSDYWLSGIPKSGKSSVLVLCSGKDRTIDITCGWVEYTRNKVIVREIVSINGPRHEVETHERFFSEVVMVFISDDEESKVCVRVTETK